MSILPLNRIQCDRCMTVFVLTAQRSSLFGQELYDAGWRARPRRGGGAYRHACNICADEFIAEHDGRPMIASAS